MGANAARERVRVARALVDRPVIRERFSKGDLSFSKVRAITRVANDDNESELADMAMDNAAHIVERNVQQYRWCRDLEEMEAENDKAQWQYDRRSLTYRWREDGCLHVQSVLPPEQGAVFLKSLNIAEENLLRDSKGQYSENPSSETVVTVDGTITPETAAALAAAKPTQRRADALGLLAEAHLNSAESSKLADRYQVVVNVDYGALTSASKLGLNFGETDATPQTEESLHPSRMNNSSTSDALDSTEKVTAVTPNSCSSAINTAMHQGRKARATSVESTLPQHRSYLENGPTIPAVTASRICCDASVIPLLTQYGEPLAIGRKSPIIPASIRRALIQRDQCCQFPGCGATRYCDGHHLVSWADGGNTDLTNICLICRFHHRLIHEGRFTVEWRSTQLQEASKHTSKHATKHSRSPASQPPGKQAAPHGGKRKDEVAAKCITPGHTDSYRGNEITLHGVQQKKSRFIFRTPDGLELFNSPALTKQTYDNADIEAIRSALSKLWTK